MFNGIIKHKGIVNKIFKRKKNCLIEIKSKMKLNKSEIGSSICCSGTCLTINSFNKKNVIFYISKETLNKTNFKYLNKGEILNLEKSIKFGDRISGHFIQGHVDTTGIVSNINIRGKSWFINIKILKKYRRYIVEKGSIAINGVSLTISKIISSGFQVVVIPQSLKLTNLIYIKKNNLVNIEFDIMGKYIKNFIK